MKRNDDRDLENSNKIRLAIAEFLKDVSKKNEDVGSAVLMYSLSKIISTMAIQYGTDEESFIKIMRLQYQDVLQKVNKLNAEEE